MEPSNNLSILQFTQKTRAPDRYNSNTVHELDFGTQKLKLVCLIEIIDPWNHAREISQNLANRFAETFNSSRHQSVLTRFEDALKQTNSYLKTNQEKITVPISCIFAVQEKNEVYFSTIGTFKVLLLRDGHINSLATNKSDDQEFGAVTSGTLYPNDWLFYLNKPFFDIVRDIEAASLSDTTSTQLEKMIRANIEPVQYNILNGVALKYEENLGIISTVYLDEQPKKIKIELPLFHLPIIQLSKIISYLKEISARIKLPKPKSGHTPKKPPNNKPNVQVTYYEDKVTVSKKTPVNKVFGFISVLLLRLSILTKPIVLMPLLILLISGASCYTYLVINSRYNTVAQTTTSSPAPTLISDLRSSTSPDKSRTIIATELTQDRYQAMSTDNQKTFSSLAHSAGVAIAPLPKALFSTSTSIAAITAVPKTNLIYAIDTLGQLWFWDGKTVSKVNQSSTANPQTPPVAGQTLTQTITVQTPVSLTSMSKSVVLASDSSNNIFLFDGSANNPPTELNQPSAWTGGWRYLQTYGSNLYVLTMGDGTVHRIPGFISNIANDVAINKGAVTTDDTVLSFIINGDITTLSTKAGLVDHQKTGKGVTLIDPGQVSTKSTATFSADGILMCNNDLVSSYNMQGAFQTATNYLSNSPIVVTTTDSQGANYIVIGNNVYKL